MVKIYQMQRRNQFVRCVISEEENEGGIVCCVVGGQLQRPIKYLQSWCCSLGLHSQVRRL